MPKATELTPDHVTASHAVSPAAATAPRSPMRKKAAGAKTMPLQVRLPREVVRAIKIAAAEREQNISDFMLACFHAYMNASKR